MLRDLFNNSENNIAVKSGDHIFVEDSAGNIRTTSSVVDHEGMVVFESIGQVEAVGRSLEELTAEVKKLIQLLPDSQNVFQLQITEFLSQKAFLSVHGQAGIVLPITDKPINLVRALLNNRSTYDFEYITQIKLKEEEKFMCSLLMI